MLFILFGSGLNFILGGKITTVKYSDTQKMIMVPILKKGMKWAMYKETVA